MTTIQIVVPFLACIIGILAYALSTNAKVSMLGLIMYACGLLVTLELVANHTLKF